MKQFRKAIAMLTLLIAGSLLPAVAQTNGSNTPYSRYGFGLMNDRAGGFNKGMSGLAYGMQNGRELNVKNPASYADIDSLSFLFDFGMSLQNGNFNQSGKKINARNAAVDYMTMGFRLAPRLGMSIGLLPYSTIGYSINYPRTLDLTGGEVTQTTMYSGDGGLHEVYAGWGWRPFKPISIGVNAGYLWGDMTHTVLASFSDASISSRRRRYEADVSTYKVDFGLQYRQRLNKKNSLVLGLSYGLGHDVNSTAKYYDQKLLSGTTADGDEPLRCANAYRLPHTFGAGLVWEHKGRLRVGGDYTFSKWDDVKYPYVNTKADGTEEYVTRVGDFTNQHKVAFGAEYLPKPEGLKWRDHVRYRVGFSYTSPYTRIDGLDGPTSYCVSLGAALPIVNAINNRSMVNVALQYEHVKPKAPGMIREQYLRICVGISFNERWFMKWKVE